MVRWWWWQMMLTEMLAGDAFPTWLCLLRWGHSSCRFKWTSTNISVQNPLLSHQTKVFHHSVSNAFHLVQVNLVPVVESQRPRQRISNVAAFFFCKSGKFLLAGLLEYLGIVKSSKRLQGVQIICNVSRWSEKCLDDMKSILKIRLIWKVSRCSKKCPKDLQNICIIRKVSGWSEEYLDDVQSICMIWKVSR